MPVHGPRPPTGQAWLCSLWRDEAISHGVIVLQTHMGAGPLAGITLLSGVSTSTMCLFRRRPTQLSIQRAKRNYLSFAIASLKPASPGNPRSHLSLSVLPDDSFPCGQKTLKPSFACRLCGDREAVQLGHLETACDFERRRVRRRVQLFAEPAFFKSQGSGFRKMRASPDTPRAGRTGEMSKVAPILAQIYHRPAS